MSKVDRCHNISGLRDAAKKAIPATFFDYMDGGSEDEVTLRRNQSVFGAYQFVPRVLVDVSSVKLSRELFGTEAPMPLALAPTGMSRMFHYEGEKAVARAADAFGVPYTLSTVASTSIEDVAALASNRLFQIYVWKNLDVVKALIERCRQQNYGTLMLAVDTATVGNRERDYQHGYGRPVEMRLRTAMQALRKPAWLYRFVTSGSMTLANLTDVIPPGEKIFTSLDNIKGKFDPSVNWDSVASIKRMWNGPLLIKGIQCVADAKRAVECGVDGIVLSNHGGRQLDGAPTGLELLPQVVAETGGATDVYIDGGIRRGSDIVKAIALGAKAVFIGRPYLYGLAAGGEAGVTRALQILHEEMERVMMLIGCASIDDLDASFVERIAKSRAEY